MSVYPDYDPITSQIPVSGINDIDEVGGYLQIGTVGISIGYSKDKGYTFALGVQTSAGVSGYGYVGISIVPGEGFKQFDGYGVGIAPPTGMPSPVTGGIFYDLQNNNVYTQTGLGITDLFEGGFYSVTDKVNYKCFPAETLITMADGSQKAIVDIRIGDEVMAYDASSHHHGQIFIYDQTSPNHGQICNNGQATPNQGQIYNNDQAFFNHGQICNNGQVTPNQGQIYNNDQALFNH